MRLFMLFGVALCLPAQDTRFDARSRLVIVPTTVTDGAGVFVAGLEPADFTLLDNGRAQPVTVDTVDTGVAPVALVIAVQSSGISAAVIEKVRKIGSLIEPLVTGERGCAAVASFAQRVVWLRECTGDAAEIKDALEHIVPGEPTQGRMLDAVSQAIDHLRARTGVRRVLLLISESRDRGSETDLASAAAAAQAAGVTIYAATYSAYKTAFTTKTRGRLPETSQTRLPTPPGNQTPSGAPPGPKNPKVIPVDDRFDILAGVTELARLHKEETTKTLAEETGGATFSFARQKGLEQSIEKMGAELHSQYVLSFTPVNAEPGFHKIEVRVRKGGYRVRARPGYWETQ